MTEVRRILAHIEAGHKEVYPFCGEYRQSKGAESPASGHGAVLVRHTQPPSCGGERMDGPINSIVNPPVTNYD